MRTGTHMVTIRLASRLAQSLLALAPFCWVTFGTAVALCTSCFRISRSGRSGLRSTCSGISTAAARLSWLAAAGTADPGWHGRGIQPSGSVSEQVTGGLIAKLTTAEEEVDEASYWLELLVACQ